MEGKWAKEGSLYWWKVREGCGSAKWKVMIGSMTMTRIKSKTFIMRDL
jgi:hypothetical protein